MIEDTNERKERASYYQAWTRERILQMKPDDLLEYIGKLWAMLTWGNKQYYVDKMISDNGFENIRTQLADFIWSDKDIETRWDSFKENIKGVGPAILSELLCHVHPKKHIIWNRVAEESLRYLGVKGLPRYNYQLTGKKYKELTDHFILMRDQLIEFGLKSVDLLTVDYFLWDELSDIAWEQKKKREKGPGEPEKSEISSKSFHNEIRDAVADIGGWLGFKASIERKVADGSRVDAIWESEIGNMGRVIYVFEVQSKGQIDSLILNLFKAMNNPAVQGVVAVSDSDQLDKIKQHAANVGDLNKKLRYWDVEEVLEIHSKLESVNANINKLNLVPEGF